MPLNREKCARCRKDKQKCTPAAREWILSRTKCDRCQRTGYECGPPESTTGLSRRFSSTSPAPRPLCCAAPAPRPRSSSAFRGIFDSNHEDSAQKAANNGNLPSFGFPAAVESATHKEDGSSESLGECLAVCLALQRLLFRWQLDSQKLNTKSGTVNMIDEYRIFEALQNCLRNVWQKMLVDAQLQLASLDSMRRETEEPKLEILQYMYRSIQLQQQIAVFPEGAAAEDRDAFAPLAGSTLHEFTVLMCTEYVLNDVHSADSSDSTSRPTRRAQAEDYEMTSIQIHAFIARFLMKAGEVPFEIGGSGCSETMSKTLHNGFPASHIAFVNQDIELARKMWKTNGRFYCERDILARSFAHIAAEAGDLGTLQFIGQESPDSEAIRNAGLDHHGRSLLAVAALLGNRDAFTIILDRCADTSRNSIPPDSNLLNLAVRGGSTAIVRKLLTDNMVKAPYTTALETAIELAHVDIIEQLLQRMEKVKHNDEALWRLAKHAAKHGYPAIECRLREMVFPSAIVQHTTTYPDYLRSPEWSTSQVENSCPNGLFDPPHRSPWNAVCAEVAPITLANTFWQNMDSCSGYSSLSDFSAIDNVGDPTVIEAYVAPTWADHLNDSTTIYHDPLSLTEELARELEELERELESSRKREFDMLDDSSWSLH